MAALSVYFADRGRQLVDGPRNLVLGDYRRRRQKKMISGDAVDATLHGIDEEAAVQDSGAYTRGEGLFGREGTLAFFVGDEFNRPQQADAADVTDCIFIPQTVQRLLKLCCGRAG